MAQIVSIENPDLDGKKQTGQAEPPPLVVEYKSKGGRPPVTINWTDFDKLCALQCTKEEIAGWFQCSPDTIERAVSKQWKMKFGDYWREKAAKGKIALRRAQFQKAQKGDTLMLIWLGKQWLGQADKPTPLDYEDDPEVDESQVVQDTYGVVFVGQPGAEDTRQPPVAAPAPEPVLPSNAPAE